MTLIILVAMAIYLKFTQPAIPPPEPLFDLWSIIHFGGFLGSYLFFKPLCKHEKYLIIALIMLIALIEIWEYPQDTHYWITSIGNNVVDIVVGIAGLIVGIIIAHSNNG